MATRYRVQLVPEGEDRDAPTVYTGAESLEALLATLYASEPRELFGAVYLDAKRRVLGTVEAYKGLTARCEWEPKGFLTPALLLNASSFLVHHNHPGGTVRPSGADIDSTRRLAAAAATLGFKLLDHLIYAEGRIFRMSAVVDLHRFDQPGSVAERPFDGRSFVRPKYRDPVTGATWAGRGSTPSWLRQQIEAGRSKPDFLIAE